MERIELPGVPMPASRIVVGVADAKAARDGPALWHAFVERGGNAFDTAYWYGKANERALGTWIEHAGLRERLVLVGKGAHPPRCGPEHVLPQLEQSLERLRTDRVDLYLLHRDDSSIPVSDWVDALDELVSSGRAHAIGASNWTPERFDAFNRDAAHRGRARLAVLSNQLSLAEMVAPPWPGCLAADGETRAWLERTQTPLLAWSAQARGFFSGRPDGEAEMKRSWMSAANVARRLRARELAERLDASAVSVALAWVLARPFPTLAVVGPRTDEELDACLAATAIELSDEMAREVEVYSAT